MAWGTARLLEGLACEHMTVRVCVRVCVCMGVCTCKYTHTRSAPQTLFPSPAPVAFDSGSWAPAHLINFTAGRLIIEARPKYIDYAGRSIRFLRKWPQADGSKVRLSFTLHFDDKDMFFEIQNGKAQ